MPPHRCETCGAEFPYACLLRRHRARKTPCAPILAQQPPAAGHHACRFCNRTFAQAHGVTQHMRRCRVANTERGMQTLMEQTLRLQNAALQREVTELRAAAGARVVVNNVTINIHPFTDPSGALRIPYEHLHGMFVGPNAHPLLRRLFEAPADVRYSSNAPPTVAAGFTRIMQKSHEDPGQRNVYLNPARQDQAMVWNGAAWQVLPLDEAIRKVFDTVADGLDRISYDNALLPAPPEAGFDHHLNLREAVGALGLGYRDHEEECIARARAAIAAHFANLASPAY